MPGRAWQQSEVGQLKRRLAVGVAASQIELIGRSPAAIRGKAARLGLIGDGIPRSRWSTEDERTLRKLFARGWSVKRIAETKRVLANYSRSAIAKKAGRLELVDRVRSLRARQIVRFTKGQLWRFQSFLWLHAANCTPEQISLMWNEKHLPIVSRSRVIYHLSKLGIKRPWKDIIQMPYSKAKQRQVSRKAQTAQNRRWTEYRTELVRKLRKAAQQMRKRTKQSGTPVRIRACRDCNCRWPEIEPFFHVSRKRTRTGPRRYVGRICKLCRNRRRRQSQKLRKSATYKR